VKVFLTILTGNDVVNDDLPRAYDEIVEILKKMYPILSEVAPNVAIITPAGDAPVGQVENCINKNAISHQNYCSEFELRFFLIINLLKAEKTEKTIITVESSVPGQGTIAQPAASSWCVML